MATVSCLSLSFVAFHDQLAFGAFLGFIKTGIQGALW